MQDLDVSLLRDIRLSSQIFFCTIVATFTTVSISSWRVNIALGYYE